MSEKELFGKWADLQDSDDLAVMQLIDAGVRAEKDFKPLPPAYFSFIGDKTKKLRILDFGCGIGRNLAGMVKLAPAWEVHGYDNAPMLARAEVYLKNNLSDKERNRIILFNEWASTAKAEIYDCIFCALVLQHLSPDVLKQRLAEFAALSDWLVIVGRKTLDDLVTPVEKFLLAHFKIIKEQIISHHVPDYDEHRFTLLKVTKEKNV